MIVGYPRGMRCILLSGLLMSVVAGGGLWIARGIYDEIMMDDGVFHVINADASQRSIELTFPSGERRGAVIQSGQAIDFHVENTGEGSVMVTADGEHVGSVGYVTSINSLIVIVVQPEGALFSQYFRGLESDT